MDYSEYPDTRLIEVDDEYYMVHGYEESSELRVIRPVESLMEFEKDEELEKLLE